MSLGHQTRTADGMRLGSAAVSRPFTVPEEQPWKMAFFGCAIEFFGVSLAGPFRTAACRVMVKKEKRNRIRQEYLASSRGGPQARPNHRVAGGVVWPRNTVFARGKTRFWPSGGSGGAGGQPDGCVSVCCWFRGRKAVGMACVRCTAGGAPVTAGRWPAVACSPGVGSPPRRLVREGVSGGESTPNRHRSASRGGRCFRCGWRR